jgi:hypothetical protein
MLLVAGILIGVAPMVGFFFANWVAYGDWWTSPFTINRKHYEWGFYDD